MIRFCSPGTLPLSGLLLLVLTAPAASQPAGEDWGQFRGPRVDATVTGSGIFSHPDGFSLNVAWKKPIGSGYSGVSVAGRYVVTMYAAGEREVMLALDRNSGEELWSFDVGPRYRGRDGSFDGPIATPLLTAGRAIGLNGFGRLFAVGLQDGKLAWSTDLVAEHGAVRPLYGFSSSPVLAGDVLVVEIGAPEAAVAGFDPQTGARRWVLGADTINHQTAVPLTVGGRPQLVASGDTHLFGIDPAAGKLLWSYPHGGAGPRGSMSMVAVPAGDNRLFLAHKDDASAAVALNPGADGVAVTQLWEGRALRNSYAVPVYHKGHVYGFSSRFLTCIDAATGRPKWRSRPPGDGFPILVDGHLVILTKDGSLHVAEARPEGFEEKARLQLFSDLAWTPPGFGGGSFFVRSLGEIARVDVEAGLKVIARDGEDSGINDTPFDRFLSEVSAASDKAAVIDRFLESQTAFPIVDGGQVHFVYRGPGDDLALAGDLIGSRQEVPMQRIEGTHFFYYTASVDRAARVNYVFIRDYEEIADPRNPRRSRSTFLARDMEFSMTGETIEMSELAMPDWRPPDFLGEPAGGARGRLEAHQLDSDALQRTVALQIYLPAGYPGSGQRLPVAYVHGGDLALERGDYARALDNLIAAGRIRPLIAVFVEQNLTSAPPAYAEMFAGELIPFVDGRYMTDARAGSRVSIGSGFSGYDAFFTAFSGAGTVGGAAAQTVFMLDTQEDLLFPKIPPAGSSAMKVYLDWGRYDMRNHQENWDMIRTQRRFARLLHDKGYAVEGGEVPDGSGWASFRNRTDRIFELFFPAAPSADR